MQIESRRAVITICLEFFVDKEYFPLKGQREKERKEEGFFKMIVTFSLKILSSLM